MVVFEGWSLPRKSEKWKTNRNKLPIEGLFKVWGSVRKYENKFENITWTSVCLVDLRAVVRHTFWSLLRLTTFLLLLTNFYYFLLCFKYFVLHVYYFSTTVVLLFVLFSICCWCVCTTSLLHAYYCLLLLLLIYYMFTTWYYVFTTSLLHVCYLYFFTTFN